MKTQGVLNILTGTVNDLCCICINQTPWETPPGYNWCGGSSGASGDPGAYPLLPWLIKGYSGPNLSQEQAAFNSHLNGLRVKVEHTFGRLKGRWCILAKLSDIHHSFMPTGMAACCVLHNICEMEKQRFVPPSEDSRNEGERQPRRL